MGLFGASSKEGFVRSNRELSDLFDGFSIKIDESLLCGMRSVQDAHG